MDDDGPIDVGEFFKLMFPACSESLTKLQRKFSHLNDVKVAFRKVDADNDGHITHQELKGMMAGFPDHDVDAVFALGEADKSGGIDYVKFIALMIPNSDSMFKKISSLLLTRRQLLRTSRRLTPTRAVPSASKS